MDEYIQYLMWYCSYVNELEMMANLLQKWNMFQGVQGSAVNAEYSNIL